eukprot:CAMPEP_0180327556 /NCGR_PEP_ID=MMETSP0988-20121125/39633_1 /TAXON_ID=697907 /ORGANISM="non described non described, Strain CCMP2293" /LENGTH=45 /DNA_ID= /DNA_START= /DNA_END= /DNA_ORIENTATION=
MSFELYDICDAMQFGPGIAARSKENTDATFNAPPDRPATSPGTST